MQGYELVQKIKAERAAHPDRIFIKWWRKEEDFIDFDLAARFQETVDDSSVIAGFELIGMEEMWEVVEQRSKGKVAREEKGGVWTVRWTPPEGAEDVERRPEYPYTAETLLKILDAETGDNFVD